MSALKDKIERPGIKEKFLAALAKGATYNLACGYAGISYRYFHEYLKKGESICNLHEEQIEAHEYKNHYLFYSDVKRVESYAALKWLEKIDKASDTHWQAAAWKLERRHPEDYGRYDREKKADADDKSLDKARAEVEKLKSDGNGQPTAT